MSNPDKLASLRKEIDQLNTQLVALLNKRASLAVAVGKAKSGGVVYFPAREAQILKRLEKLNSGPLSDEALKAIFKEVIAGCRQLQHEFTVAFLGPAGTYSEAAARKHFGASCQYLCCDSFNDVVKRVEQGKAQAGILPIENSTEGTINATLDLLAETSLSICGETLLPIHHQLLSKAKSLAGITAVIAHPQSLGQCRRWLDKYLPGVARQAASSNAEAARLVAKQPTHAAIAGIEAAKLYGLPIMASNIEDDPRNTTRFIVVGASLPESTGADKTSILCALPHKTGSLHALLGVFAKHGVNLCKLESRPLPRTPWEYLFYIDLDGHAEDAAVAAALRNVQKQAVFYKLLGAYPRATEVNGGV